VDDLAEISVPQLPKLRAETTELIGSDGIEAAAVYPIQLTDPATLYPAGWQLCGNAYTTEIHSGTIESDVRTQEFSWQG